MNKTFKEGIEKGAEQLAQSVRETLPKVQFNKNGYEIRTQVLEMAKHFTEFEYSSRWNGWEITSKRDPESGEIVNKVGMPEIPGVDDVLESCLFRGGHDVGRIPGGRVVGGREGAIGGAVSLQVVRVV